MGEKQWRRCACTVPVYSTVSFSEWKYTFFQTPVIIYTACAWQSCSNSWCCVCYLTAPCCYYSCVFWYNTCCRQVCFRLFFFFCLFYLFIEVHLHFLFTLLYFLYKYCSDILLFHTDKWLEQNLLHIEQKNGLVYRIIRFQWGVVKTVFEYFIKGFQIFPTDLFHLSFFPLYWWTRGKWGKIEYLWCPEFSLVVISVKLTLWINWRR